MKPRNQDSLLKHIYTRALRSMPLIAFTALIVNPPFNNEPECEVLEKVAKG